MGNNVEYQYACTVAGVGDMGKKMAILIFTIKNTDITPTRAM
jgi:hypothetical protein